jgi:arylsulfatase A-like enzyme
VKTSSYICIALLALVGASSLLHATDRPNIVIIYADDMGYGDLNIQNPGSKIPTPNLDQLAREGMRFTDAHSSSGICSPSRFALLTGTYHWRRQHGIVNSFGPPSFFRDDDYTLPQMLKDAGYRTAAIGKWHMGFNWTFKNPPSGRVEQWNRVREYYKYEDVDWTQPITGGPLDRGFDYYFGDGTINFPPYAWMENERMLDLPTSEVDINNMPYDTLEGNWEFRPGLMVEGWNPYDVLPTLTKKAVEWVHQQEADQPFFLYFPLPSPHAPTGSRVRSCKPWPTRDSPTTPSLSSPRTMDLRPMLGNAPDVMTTSVWVNFVDSNVTFGKGAITCHSSSNGRDAFPLILFPKK